jgi:predicted ATP-dependent endonuclease of OLD family
VLLSDAVVFVEGESDLKVIQEWCRIAEIELAGTNTSILPMHSLWQFLREEEACLASFNLL